MSYSHGCRCVNRDSPLQHKNFGCRVRNVVDGERLSARMSALGLSQSELARRVGVAQQTIYKLITGASRSSSHLHRIARELETTPAYLTGETDDASSTAPPPPAQPRHQLVTLQLQVVLPSEDALAQMFEGLLLPLERAMPVDELARTLAKRLPIGLSQLRDLLPIDPTVGTFVPAGDHPPRGKAHRASPPVPRT